MDEKELSLLRYVVQCMEESGANRNIVWFDVDQKLADEIYSMTGIQYSIPDLRKAADKCLAHEWITHTTLGSKYEHLQITEKGLGIVISKQRTQHQKDSRGLLKKFSDLIVDHKGIFLLLSFLGGLAGFLLVHYWRKT